MRRLGMSRWIVICVFLFCIPLSALGEDGYSGEKKVIMDMIETMETYSVAMADAETTIQVAEANNELSDNLEVFTPKMKEMSSEHPEWGESPPDEIQPLIVRYMEVFTVFNNESLKKALDYANTYMEDQELQDSFKRLNMVIMKLY
jgi:hypothetical protein